MRQRTGEVWEAKGHMNGERVVVVVESRPAKSDCTVHRVLHITGARTGRILEWTEQHEDWDKNQDMTRLA